MGRVARVHDQGRCAAGPPIQRAIHAPSEPPAPVQWLRRGTCGENLRRPCGLEERGALALPYISARRPRFLKYFGEQPPLLGAEGDLGLLGPFFSVHAASDIIKVLTYFLL